MPHSLYSTLDSIDELGCCLTPRQETDTALSVAFLDLACLMSDTVLKGSAPSANADAAMDQARIETGTVLAGQDRSNFREGLRRDLRPWLKQLLVRKSKH